MEETIVTAAIALGSGAAGAFLFSLLPTRKPRRKLGIGAHVHEFDHMRGDGKGWRCSVCDEPRGY